MRKALALVQSRWSPRTGLCNLGTVPPAFPQTVHQTILSTRVRIPIAHQLGRTEMY
jgi:hypothetical protein